LTKNEQNKKESMSNIKVLSIPINPDFIEDFKLHRQ